MVVCAAGMPRSAKLYYYTPLKKIKTDCFFGDRNGYSYDKVALPDSRKTHQKE
jgi:hypothetical protein